MILRGSAGLKKEGIETDDLSFLVGLFGCRSENNVVNNKQTNLSLQNWLDQDPFETVREHANCQAVVVVVVKLISVAEGFQQLTKFVMILEVFHLMLVSNAHLYKY